MTHRANSSRAQPRADAEMASPNASAMRSDRPFHLVEQRDQRGPLRGRGRRERVGVGRSDRGGASRPAPARVRCWASVTIGSSACAGRWRWFGRRRRADCSDRATASRSPARPGMRCDSGTNTSSRCRRSRARPGSRRSRGRPRAEGMAHERAIASVRSMRRPRSKNSQLLPRVMFSADEARERRGAADQHVEIRARARCVERAGRLLARSHVVSA